MADKHSLPWSVVPDYTDGFATGYARVWGGDGAVIHDYIVSDDAEFIVRACNSHYELLEALEAVVESGLDEYWASQNASVVESARAAIAKAEAK